MNRIVFIEKLKNCKETFYCRKSEQNDHWYKNHEKYNFTGDRSSQMCYLFYSQASLIQNSVQKNFERKVSYI